MSIILLCSGNLGFLLLKEIFHSYNLNYVFTDKNSFDITEFCVNNKIDFYAGNPRKSEAKNAISSLSCDVIFSINYLFIVEKDILSLARKMAINLHGSLLPKYRGRTPHVWAIINGEKETGVSAHLMTSEVDDGAVLKNVIVKIEENETGYSLLQKFNKIYPEIVHALLLEIGNNEVSAIEQDQTKATYFGKRTPDDGLINWNWQKERIRNWVRAQAEPYPGAFTYYCGAKMIINEIIYSDLGFNFQDPNGTILSIDPHLIVKSPNGAVLIKKFKAEQKIEFTKGNILS